MRHFVLALMIALLPLRGWVGDAMAMEIAAGTLAESVSALDSDELHARPARVDADFDAANAIHADCPGHASALDGAPHAASDCKTCADCQICHSVALTPSLPQLAPAAVSAVQPLAATPLFASAERALGFKPPIS